MLAVPAMASSRVALVIGNSIYAHVPALANPRNDAADVGAALGRLGFSVTRLDNADYATLRRGLQAFRREAAAAGIAVVFYAGHGIEVNKRNFLVPVDARLQTDGDVEYESVPLDLVMGAVHGASEFRLVVLDACRDNPFLASMKREEGSTRSIGRGLSRAEPAGGDTLLAYSAKEGAVALDGKGRNSPYTGALLRYLEEPGLEVGLMFRKVRDAVIEATGRTQEPYAYSSLSARGAYFIPPAVRDPQSEAPVATVRSAIELEHWKTINTIEDAATRLAALLDYKAKFPGGVYAGLADIQIESFRARGDTDELKPDASPESVETGLGLTREDRRRIQRALTAAGFRPGQPDGLFGHRTRAAIAEWQAGEGVQTTGYLDAYAAKALLAHEHSRAADAPLRAQVSDPSAIVLANGLRLSDWVMLAEDRLAEGDYRKLLVEGMGHLREHGAHSSVETVVERALDSLLAKARVVDDASARSVLRTVEQVRDVVGEHAKLARLEARALAQIEQFPAAVEAYRSWLRLAPADHPERREMLAAMQMAERGQRQLKVGERFRDCAECPELVVVPPGSFMMGSRRAEIGRNVHESPMHPVTIGKPFAVGVHEVTFAQWEACRREGDCKHVPDDQGWGRGTRPVIHVSWQDAQQYAGWLSSRTRKRYRLLSESEWEYAARGGTRTAFHYGATLSTELANFDGDHGYGSSRKGQDRNRTMPVGSFPANAFGLHDLHGNVWEWVEDCWHGSYDGAPADGRAWVWGGNCSSRVVRGGSWDDAPRKLRVANRDRNPAILQAFTVGFRVARTLD